MINPFTEKYVSDKTDENLIKNALEGERKSLEELILRHQAWIYNLAIRMVFYPDEAKDVTQEILIKIITKLSTFRGNSSFRTWVYRIVVNHVLNMKLSAGEKKHEKNFNDYSVSIDNVPDMELPDQSLYEIDMKIIVEEVKLSCMAGMLLCLDREQRLIFILGAVFQVKDIVAGEILEISRDAYRQKLSRARRQLYNFMHQKCGLISKDNPCRCEKKTKVLVDAGYVNPKNLLFNINYIHSVQSATGEKAARLDNFVGEKCETLFRENPFQNSPDFVSALRKTLDNSEFKDIFNFTN